MSAWARPFSAPFAAGVASITIQPATQGTGVRSWQINAIGLSTTSTSPTECSVYLNGLFVCGSQSGNLDSADGDPIIVRSTDTLLIQWTGGSAGATANALLSLDLAG